MGWTLAALIGYFVIPASEDGWRWAFALGAIPAAYALIVRWGLPESARWLERRGRFAEAEAVVRTFEDAAGTVPTATPTRADAPPAAATSLGQRLGALWAKEFRVRTACLWLVWFCVNFSYYGAFIWIPSILVAQGYDLVRSFGFTLVITLAQLPGYAVAAWLIEVWGRRATLSVFLVGSAVSADLLRHGERPRSDHRRRDGAVVLQPRSLGRAVRGHPRDVSDVAPRHGDRMGRGRRPHRIDRGTPRGAAAADRGRRTGAVRRVRGVLRRGGRAPRGGWSTAAARRSTIAERGRAFAGPRIGWGPWHPFDPRQQIDPWHP